MEMHYSLYNHMVKLSSGGWGLYNFRTGELVKLNFFSKHFFDNVLDKDPNDSKYRILKKKGFIVDFDERKRMKIEALAGASKSDVLGLLITPTMDCNFDCSYCYEWHRTGCMSKEVQDQLVEYVRIQSQKSHLRALSITWYGGEPLLEPDIIADLSKRLIKHCKENAIDYKASIVTNGYFLTQQIIDMLEKSKVTSVMITLDGPDAKSHDKTRFLRGGQGTFDTIINNLYAIKTHMEIKVRCNLHKGNKDDYLDFEKMVKTISQKTGNTVTLQPGIMDSEVSVHNQVFSDTLKMDFDEISEIRKQEYMGEEKIPIFKFSPVRCMACNIMGIAVDEKGGLYKCWENVGDEREYFGHLSDYIESPENPMLDYNVLDKYLGEVWPENDEKCMNCKVLPICHGGCPRKVIYFSKRKCKQLADESLQDYYVEELCKKIFG